MVRWCPVLLLLTSCDGWPLYAHLPADQPPTLEPSTSVVDEEAGTEVQGLPPQSAPARVTVLGAASSCGFDAGLGGDWPERPLDGDGDGVPEATGAARTGWYTGDVDTFVLTAVEASLLELRLEWDAAPDADQNAPYRPDDPAGAWSTETDMDVLVHGYVDDAVVGVLLETGASRAVPEVIPEGIPLAAGEAVALAVACHHGAGGPWELTVDLHPL